MNFWPRRIRQTYPNLHRNVTQAVGKAFALLPEFFDEMLGKFDYGDYATKVDRVMVDSLADSKLVNFLSERAPAAVLYTGGGIVPASLLKLCGVKFLHFHPGVLPYIRGADGLLWSMLVRGNPGASAFYMEPGIDTGPVIATRDYPALSFELSGGKRPDDQTLYRAIFSFFDPVLRARLMADVFRSGGDLMNLPCTPQEGANGITYHFMSDPLRRAALERLFPRQD
ncbi:formyltransferase family protein [Nitrospinota bacterium]